MVTKSSIQIYFDEFDELYLSLSNIYKKIHPKSDEEKKQILDNYISDYSSPSPLNSLDLENLKDLTLVAHHTAQYSRGTFGIMFVCCLYLLVFFCPGLFVDMKIDVFI